MDKNQFGIIIGGKLNLREHPTTQSKRLVLIPNGEQINVSEYNEQW